MPSRDYKSVNLFAPRSSSAECNGETSSVVGRHRVSNGMYRVHKILSAEEVAAGQQTRWLELELRGAIRNVSPELWQFQHLTALFLCNNILQRLSPHIAKLTNLQLLDLSNNKLKSVPAELGDMISLQSLYLNNNQIRILPYEIGKLFRLSHLGLSGNPLTPEIAQIYREQSGTQKLLQFLLDHLTISVPPPPERQWIVTRDYETEPPSGTFSIMSYNILCDKYATTSVYAYCPSWALTWDYRKKYVLSEITRHDSDIVALQEVETDQFHTFFKPELASRGYTGAFSPKSRAKTMSEDERKYVDGCAIFWKSNKFDLDSEHVIEFTRLAIAKAEGNEQMLNRVMTRDNIALVAVFKIRSHVYPNGIVGPSESSVNVINSPLVVCTAHVHWDPEFCDVKLIQSMMLVQELSAVVEKTAEKWHLPANSVPVVVCGDLNSLPNSGVYEYLTFGKIPADHVDFKDFKGETCIQKLSTLPFLHDAYSHKLKLRSAYDSNVLAFTNYTYDFRGVIDYIFATPGLIRLGVLGPMDFSWFQSNKIVGCPFPGIPSDHIPLVAQYAIMPTSVSRFL